MTNRLTLLFLFLNRRNFIKINSKYECDYKFKEMDVFVQGQNEKQKRILPLENPLEDLVLSDSEGFDVTFHFIDEK